MKTRPNDSSKFPPQKEPVAGTLATVKPDIEVCPFRSLINTWLEACRRFDDLSPKTIQDYHDKVYKFWWWWSEYSHYAQQLGAHPKNVGTPEARQFAAYLRESVAFRWGITDNKNNKRRDELSPASVAAYGRAVKVFFNWLEREAYIEKTPFNKSVKFTSPRKMARVIKTIESEALTKIFDTLTRPEKLQTFIGRRNLAIVALLLDSGIRRGELLSLRLCDLDLEKNRCIVRGKTGERTALFGELCRNALVNYLQSLQSYALPLESPLWLCEDGQALSYAGFGIMLRRLEKASEVDFHAHSLRHTFATMMAAKKINVYDLKELLGHHSINTTQIYIQQDVEHLAEEHRSRSPLSSLSSQQQVNIRRRGRPRGRASQIT